MDLAARGSRSSAVRISQLGGRAARSFKHGSRSSAPELRDPSGMDPAARPPSCGIRAAELRDPYICPNMVPKMSKMAPRWAKKGLGFRVWGLLKQSIRVGEPFRNQLRSGLVLHWRMGPYKFAWGLKNRRLFRIFIT